VPNPTCANLTSINIREKRSPSEERSPNFRPIIGKLSDFLFLDSKILALPFRKPEIPSGKNNKGDY